MPWVQPKDSIQWNAFKKLTELLKSRNNRLFVIIGPFNPYVLTEGSLLRYNKVRQQMESWLEAKGTACFSVPDMPSDYYADASHPLKEGYVQIAKELLQDERFQKWMQEYKSDEK